MSKLNHNSSLSQLKVNIGRTGGFANEKSEDDFLFKHLILEEVQLNELGYSPKELLSLLEIDFLSVKRHGEFDFLHTSHISNFEDIERDGLKYDPNPDFISDLGVGLYVVEEDNIEAVDHLATYISNHYDYDEEELVVVRGSYNGSYVECVAGDYHKGYIVIQEDLDASILEVDVEKIDDFLYNF